MQRRQGIFGPAEVIQWKSGEPGNRISYHMAIERDGEYFVGQVTETTTKDGRPFQSTMCTSICALPSLYAAKLAAERFNVESGEVPLLSFHKAFWTIPRILITGIIGICMYHVNMPITLIMLGAFGIMYTVLAPFKTKG